MSTLEVPILSSEWTLITTAFSGSLENQSNETALFRSSDTKPVPSVIKGHSLREFTLMSFSRTTNQPIYARTMREPGLIILTED